MENQNIVQPEKKNLIKRIPLIALVGLIVGTIGGYIYYLKVGCVSGTCAITSNPWMSSAWGGAFGYLVFDMFNGRKKKEKHC
jgi:xanthine/uracil permease